MGEGEGPAPQAREGEGAAPLSRCFLKQTRRRQFPLTFPSLTQWVPSSPRGERRKGCVVAKCDSPASRGEGFRNGAFAARNGPRGTLTPPTPALMVRAVLVLLATGAGWSLVPRDGRTQPPR